MKKMSLNYFLSVAFSVALIAGAASCSSDNVPDGSGDSDESEIPEKPEGATAYITKVLDFMPAVGQFVNSLPKYEEGDTQETMNQKVLEAIGNNKKGMISLGGFGGYVVVGFDHTIKNKEG